MCGKSNFQKNLRKLELFYSIKAQENHPKICSVLGHSVCWMQQENDGKTRPKVIEWAPWEIPS